jgi:hypothetical protein
MAAALFQSLRLAHGPARRRATETKMDYKALAEQLVKTCMKRGADAAEIFIEAGRNLSIEVRNAEIETVQEASAAGVGIRVFVKGRMAELNDLKEVSLITPCRERSSLRGPPLQTRTRPATDIGVIGVGGLTTQPSPRSAWTRRSSWPQRSRNWR